MGSYDRDSMIFQGRPLMAQTPKDYRHDEGCVFEMEVADGVDESELMDHAAYQKICEEA